MIWWLPSGGPEDLETPPSPRRPVTAVCLGLSFIKASLDYNKIAATFQLKTYCPECFPSWFSSSCLGQVCSVHAKSQWRVQSRASSHACIHIHCQWIATFHGHTLYQPHTSSYKIVVKTLIYNGVCEVDRMPSSPQTTLRVPSVLCFSLYVVPILFFKLFSTKAAL